MISKDKVVTFDYRLTDGNGKLVDSSEEEGPMVYLHGHNNLIPGLEAHLEGKEAGAAFNVSLPPADAYGDRDETLVAQVPAPQFEEAGGVQPGMMFQAMTDEGPIQVLVTRVEDDVVHVDGNHPLAGMTLTFEGTINEVRPATEEELGHGHAHGPGGHEH